PPPEPVLMDYKNIECRDAVLAWNISPQKAEWPSADFIVGNPPFLGKLYMLTELGDGYIEALRAAYRNDVPDGADYVMYWWSHAARLASTGAIKRFGLVSTKSITQPMNRRVVSKALAAHSPVRVVYAIPNHPWVDSTDGADVRIAMTVGE